MQQPKRGRSKETTVLNHSIMAVHRILVPRIEVRILVIQQINKSIFYEQKMKDHGDTRLGLWKK